MLWWGGLEFGRRGVEQGGCRGSGGEGGGIVGLWHACMCEGVSNRSTLDF